MAHGPATPPPRFTDLPDLCTPDEARLFLQVGRSTMYALLKANQIRHLTFGKLIRIPKQALLENGNGTGHDRG